jgi:hypothetical protein
MLLENRPTKLFPCCSLQILSRYSNGLEGGVLNVVAKFATYWACKFRQHWQKKKGVCRPQGCKQPQCLGGRPFMSHASIKRTTLKERTKHSTSPKKDLADQKNVVKSPTFIISPVNNEVNSSYPHAPHYRSELEISSPSANETYRNL